MYIAIAMYLGGEIIDAHNCDYSSYDNHGLRCAVCGEPVHLKKGSIRKPHFAHFSGTDPQQVEECELRASSYSNSSQINSFIKDRGQRLKIFQQHFLSLISFENDVPIANLEFNNWINAIKRDHNQVISNIIINCTDYFLKYRYKIAATYIESIANNNNKSTFIKQEIALEAINYLCVKSSLKLLEYLFDYSIYKLYEDKQNRLFKQDITTQDVDNICHLVIKIIILNNWIEPLNDIKGNSDFVVSFTVMGGNKLETPIVYTMEMESKSLLFNISYHYSEKHKNDLGETELIYEKQIVGTISAKPGTLKIQLAQILLPNKLIFGKYAFHHELLVDTVIPFWVANAEKYVLFNEIQPEWLIISKLIELVSFNNDIGKKIVNPVKELQWYQVLMGCRDKFPSVVQFQNAVNNIPEKYQYLLTPADDARLKKQAELDFQKSLRRSNYSNLS
ncbi:hypothetical protein Cylst_5311 [Cylindrospermum stagnale PCC 7417]|uniref:Competence protein CoiA-like N-terminal domain-containing protein n=1 Tax=Cylindrospermum stagnale PCC 7417 TaxID=56107 RepID=K9X5G6_9NOST|nr:competence protein CoiA family protein [Cylindrospermum stagnale]AFZ27339.1 hypothetical protein Cylst_5311 [Cylindrospermum stagnale PCC 7417]